MSWETTNHYFSGQGVVLLGLRDPDGKPMGFTPAGNVSDLKIAVAVSTLEHKESQTGQRATDLRMTTETKCSLSMTMEDFNSNNLASALRGTVTKLAGGTVTAQTIEVYPGNVTALEHLRITGFTLKEGITPLTMYPGVAGKWDYKLNADAGSFLLNSDSATQDQLTTATAGTPIDLVVGYTYADQIVVDALTSGVDELAMRFEGLNTADSNEPVVVDVFKFLTDPLKELSLISDAVQQFQLEGSVLADPARETGSKFFRVKKLS